MIITKIDEQNRIYHYLTNLKKELKPLYNIKHQLDIANSHPLLLNKILIGEYKINKEELDIIYRREGDSIDNSYNVSEQLCNELLDKGIHIPIDVVRYLYITSRGLLWDELHTQFPEFDRSEIKTLSFAHIFYNQHNIAKYTEFGRKFISLYPNVHEVISHTKDVVSLPRMLMKYESFLMKNILTQCYHNGWKVVSIHDAVIVLDVPENERIEPSDVVHIIEDVYRKNMLHPTIHCDIFSTKDN